MRMFNRLALSLHVLMLVACTLTCFGRLGETEDEAAKRYGEPKLKASSLSLSSGYGTGMLWVKYHMTNEVMRKYEKGGVEIVAAFHTNTAGNLVVGEIAYLVSKEKISDDLFNEMVTQLLQSNSNGEEWKQVQDAPSSRPKYIRPGATAGFILEGRILRFTSDAYVSYANEIQRKAAEKAAEALKKEMGAF